MPIYACPVPSVEYLARGAANVAFVGHNNSPREYLLAVIILFANAVGSIKEVLFSNEKEV